LKGLIFLQLKTGTEKEILESMAIQDAVDYEAQFVPLKINPVIADAEPMEDPAGAFQFAELIQFSLHDLLREAAEFAKDLQLQFFGHARQFGRAGGIENNLKWAHGKRVGC